METNDFRIVAARAFLATRPGLTAQELAAENAQLRELLTRTVDLADDCADMETTRRRNDRHLRWWSSYVRGGCFKTL
jgi:hypothetical protein